MTGEYCNVMAPHKNKQNWKPLAVDFSRGGEEAIGDGSASMKITKDRFFRLGTETQRSLETKQGQKYRPRKWTRMMPKSQVNILSRMP